MTSIRICSIRICSIRIRSIRIRSILNPLEECIHQSDLLGIRRLVRKGYPSGLWIIVVVSSSSTTTTTTVTGIIIIIVIVIVIVITAVVLVVRCIGGGGGGGGARCSCHGRRRHFLLSDITVLSNDVDAGMHVRRVRRLINRYSM